jgi:hypothetical protein
MVKISLFFAILCLFSTLIPKVHAALGFMEDASFPELAPSGRALAMGNAFIAKVDDASAAFYNPAGLGTVRETHFHLSNFHIEMNKGWLDLTTSGKMTDSFGNFFSGFSLEGQRELLVEKPGKMTHTRFSLMPNFTTRYFTLGYLLSTQQKARLKNEDTALFEYATRRDHGPYAGLNISLFGGVLKFGLTGIWLQRREAKGEQDRNLSVDFEDSDYDKGAALILTAGTRLTLPVSLLPTFAFVIHNAADQQFSVARGTGAPDRIKQSMDLGFSITPQVGQAMRVHFEINYKDIADAHKVASARRILAGMEVDIARTFFIRFGYGDGFGSFGIGLKSKRLEFDLTSYAVDTSTAGIRGSEDRRFAMTLSSGF